MPIHLDVRGLALPATSSLRSLLSIGWRATRSTARPVIRSPAPPTSRRPGRRRTDAQPSREPSRAADYHLLINVDGAATDERGNGTAWDRTWTAKASTSVVRTTSGYTVEVARPWSSVGGAPAAGGTLGLDLADNDSDTAGSVTPFD